MGKFSSLVYASLAMVVCCGAFGAANVLVPKKADSVVKREASTSTTATGASLLPTAANLVLSVIQLNQQQKALTAECEPTSRELNFVNNMIKEWQTPVDVIHLVIKAVFVRVVPARIILILFGIWV